MKIQKQVIIIILGCLFFGAVFGWVIRGGGDSDEESLTEEEGETIYISPMHPHIRQNEPGNCPICGMELVPMSQFKGGGDSDPYVMEMTPEAMALSNVSTTTVSRGDASGSTRLTGKIQPDEQRKKTISANYGGRIDELFVSFTGQEVARGQKLATLYSPELVNAQKELLETAKIKERQPALYNAAKEKLRLWKISDKQIEAMESSGTVQTQFNVFSDVSGIVSARNISVGDFVNRGSVLFEIVDLSRVWIMLDAYESDLAGIKKGDKVTFQASAYPGKEYTANITYIDPVLNPGTRTVAIRAEAQNPNGELKPEMFVSASIASSSTGQQGIMLPKSAILWTGPRSVVYVQVGDRESPSFEMREVKLGGRMGDNYLVLEGLGEGDEVVSNGVFAVDASAQLTGNYSMMMRPTVKTMEVDAEFTRQLTAFVNSYFTIKNALVETDGSKVRQLVPQVEAGFEKINPELLENNPKNTWASLETAIRSSLEKLKATTDVEGQRQAFEVLSDHVIEAVEKFGVSDSPIYRQYCPMAFDDKGAFWLSSEKEIRNPYFGDKMLTCGEVKEEYKPGKAVMEGDRKPAAESTHMH